MEMRLMSNDRRRHSDRETNPQCQKTFYFSAIDDLGTLTASRVGSSHASDPKLNSALSELRRAFIAKICLQTSKQSWWEGARKLCPSFLLIDNQSYICIYWNITILMFFDFLFVLMKMFLICFIKINPCQSSKNLFL